MSSKLTAMDRNQLQEYASSIKEGRLQKNYTQQELAELTGISLRSIQRIENAEVMPRAYTLKILLEHLGISVEQPVAETKSPRKSMNRTQKRIVSLSSGILLFLIAGAYVFQSSGFPETAFESFLYIACFIALYTGILVAIWK